GRELERRRRRRPVVLSTDASILASASALASASPPAGAPACFSPWSDLSDFAAWSVLSVLSDATRALSPPLSRPLAGASGFFPPSSDCAAFGADSASAASSLCSAIALNIGCSAGFFSVLGTSRLAACCSPPLFPPPPPLPPLPRRERRDSPLLRDDPDPEPELTIGSACTCSPRPWQCSQVVEKTSISPPPTRLRVICTRPSEVTSETWWRVRSRPSA